MGSKSVKFSPLLLRGPSCENCATIKASPHENLERQFVASPAKITPPGTVPDAEDDGLC